MSAALTLAAKPFADDIYSIVIVNRVGHTVETVGSIVGSDVASALAAWKLHSTVVQSGVKGAHRITTTVLASREDAKDYVARVRSSNSIGSYWAEIID